LGHVGGYKSAKWEIMFIIVIKTTARQFNITARLIH